MRVFFAKEMQKIGKHASRETVHVCLVKFINVYNENGVYNLTHYIMFHRPRIKHKAPENNLHISGSNIVRVNNTKFLGLIIDSKLN